MEQHTEHNQQTRLDVSIIVVSWNTREVLRNCLQSVYEQTQGIDFELIVIDNASADGSAEMVKSLFPQVVLIENPANLGFPAANNQGIDITWGRYVLLLNSDTVILDNAICKVVEFADKHADAAVVGCKVLNPDRTPQITCFMFPSLLNLFLAATYLYKLFPRSRFFGRELMGWWDRSDTCEVDVVGGCFMLVQTEAIRQVGKMDEQFFLYCEETDWCYRFKKAGWKTIFTPEAQIIHLSGQSTKGYRAEMLLQFWGSMLLFFKKHRSFAVHALACVLVAIFFLLRVPYQLGHALVRRNGRRNYLRIARAHILGVFYAITGGQRLCLSQRRAFLD